MQRFAAAGYRQPPSNAAAHSAKQFAPGRFAPGRKVATQCACSGCVEPPGD